MKTSPDANQLLQNFALIVFFAILLCAVVVLRGAPQNLLPPTPTVVPTLAASRATPAATPALIAPCETIAAPYRERKSPYDQQDLQVVLAGQKIYSDHCAVCHGIEGRGDGVGAMILDIKPADFTDPDVMARMPLDCQFAIISEGVTGKSMPAWKQLGEDAIWQVLHYTRGFARIR